MNLTELFINTLKPWKVYDDISLEEYSSMPALADYNPLRYSWDNITVTATEDCGDYIAVYIAY